MNIGEAIRFVFEDDQWPGKLLVGAVVSLIPLLGGAAITGYAIAVLRNVEAGSERPLPTWDRLGDYFVDGLQFWVATLIYSIPFLILACPIAVVWVLPAMAGESQDATTILTSIAGLVTAGLGCLSLLYGLLLWVLMPVLQIRLAETGDLGPCLRFGEVFAFLFDHIGAIIIAQLFVWLAAFAVTTILGGIIGLFALVPICGWVLASLLGLAIVPVGTWLMLFAAHLYGQIGLKAKLGSSVV